MSAQCVVAGVYVGSRKPGVGCNSRGCEHVAGVFSCILLQLQGDCFGQSWSANPRPAHSYPHTHAPVSAPSSTFMTARIQTLGSCGSTWRACQAILARPVVSHLSHVSICMVTVSWHSWRSHVSKPSNSLAKVIPGEHRTASGSWIHKAAAARNMGCHPLIIAQQD